MKKLFLAILICILSANFASAEDYLISTPKTSLLISATKGEISRFQYFGTRIEKDDISSIYNAQVAERENSYSTFGINSTGTKAIYVTHSDGNMSLDLVVDEVKQYSKDNASITEIVLKDKVYPFIVRQFFKAYNSCDVIGTWVEITNNAKKEVMMYKFSSAEIPIIRANNYISHLDGTWGAENTLEEVALTSGIKTITNTDGVRNTQKENPSVMITINGEPREESGDIIGASLAWSGNYQIDVEVENSGVTLFAGIKPDNSYYKLESKESFVTPELALTFSNEGKGGVSRAFHKWAREHKLNQGDIERDILLNSWEGVYFDVNQEGMDQMMSEMSAMGGELFVMDDGWFGDKYPRNDGSSSLGDWMVCKEKLPEGIEGLISSAKKHNIKFGIWIEPEMANTKSELYEKHPEWVLSQDNRPLSQGRGGTQVVLDMTNPEVQDFVFGIVDNLMTNYPEIAYIKWDANCSILNYGSHFLPKDKQSHIYIDYHRGMNKVLERIRAKYPKVVMQACASGGGRVNYGLLPYFEEFWTSDNTDALQRLYMQWSISSFYPAIAMASHVSADKNHQTGRKLPLKFRFDVAMSGRLGMEIQPKDMSEVDKEFSSRAIASYKEIRPIVQFGELYRLVSPFDKKGISSIMYTTESKDKAVVYAYKIEHLHSSIIPNLKLTGVDINKKYKIRDLTPLNANKPCSLDGKIISGKILKESGIALSSILKNEYSSVALELVEVK